MLAVAVLLGLPMLLAGAILDPEPINIGGLLSYWAIMALILPVVGWPLFLSQLVVPTAGRGRIGSVISLWVGGTTLAVSVIYWLYALLSYSPGQVDVSHRLLPYSPKTGIAMGLFGLCLLVSCGWVGAIAPLLNRDTATNIAITGGIVLFLITYTLGWLLVLS